MVLGIGKNTITNAIGGAGAGFLAGGPAGALIGAGVGGLMGYSQDATNEANRKAAREANAQNVAYWNMQNDYNSPVAQMARLKEAGLNPMLVYGGGNVTGNSASAISSANYADQSYNTMASIQGIQALANLKNTGANTASTQANTLATYQDIQNMQTANKIQQAQLEQEQQAVKMGAMDLQVAERVQKARLKGAHYGAVNDAVGEYMRFQDQNLDRYVKDRGGRELAYGWNVGKNVISDVLGVSRGLADTQASFSRASRDSAWANVLRTPGSSRVFKKR